MVAVDLEGIHEVLGGPYEGLYKGTLEYEKAVENATKEVNAVVQGLFDGGAELVAVWDNHAGGGNLDFSKIDSRVSLKTLEKNLALINARPKKVLNF